MASINSKLLQPLKTTKHEGGDTRRLYINTRDTTKWLGGHSLVRRTCAPLSCDIHSLRVPDTTCHMITLGSHSAAAPRTSSSRDTAAAREEEEASRWRESELLLIRLLCFEARAIPLIDWLIPWRDQRLFWFVVSQPVGCSFLGIDCGLRLPARHIS